MENDEVEKILNEIGQILSEDKAYPLDNTLLFARLDYGMVGPSIFKNLGNHILYRSPDLDTLGYALLDLWEEQPEGRRWAEMEYLIKDGKFEAVFVYPDELDPEEEPMDRRTRIVRRYFGDKPIVYPQPGEE
ncbi:MULTISPECIES: hypothetical protein [unclassified Sphingomonas]|uniref:hypothetical protein n=1 Tax=unclassified Sphingomonas TaxID=196159 RepID=UPI000BCC954C|nr:MAG: hypothetical protein B7Z43_07635 [Sphingomonas sp. 12-62-6]OYX37262.1 MAG: hypothetical protein B7Y98_13320 [Sphingomonas sp. 32-62-10]OYY64866.1 MAG: hypothetical protein B7Y49_08055 [Sphingomonas sp. 28-62-11]